MGYDTFVQVSHQLKNTIDARSTSICSSDSSSQQSYYDLEKGESVPLLNKRQGRFKANDINIGVLALAIILIGGVTIGTYLLMEQDREWPTAFPFFLVNRELWGAIELPTGSTLNSTNVNHVVILHTRGDECTDTASCINIIRELQKQSHLTDNKEIKYNFLIGGDGHTYEIRGWNYECGLESLPHHNSTLTVGFIGNFTYKNPRQQQIDEAKALIVESIRRKKLSAKYQMFGLQNRTISTNDGLALFVNFEDWDCWNNLFYVT